MKTGLRGMLRKHWLVMDMDGTIVPTPTKGGGKYLTLDVAATRTQLQRWIALGGSVALLSTAGARMWTQAFAPLQEVLFPPRPADLPGRLVMCGFSGAALFCSDRASKSMIEDRKYRDTAIEGGTCVPIENIPAIRRKCQEVIRHLFCAARDDATLIPLLSTKYHSVYGELVEQLRTLGEEKFFTEVLSDENAFTHGRFLKETNDAIIDTQVVPGTDPAVLVQLTVLGIPMSRFEQFFPPNVVDDFSKLGVYVKKQPNSVVIAPHGVDKATSIRYLIENAAQFDDFSLSRAIAFGDFPSSVDKPMTTFPPMSFISVSKDPEHDPPGTIHVGSEEDGTAMFLDELLGGLERGARGLEDDSLIDRKMLEAAAKSAKVRLLGLEGSAKVAGALPHGTASSAAKEASSQL